MSRTRVYLIILCAAYYALLLFSYAYVESQLFDSAGMEYFPPSMSAQLLAAAMAIAPALWLPTSIRHPSQVCYWMLYVTVVAPMMFVPYHVIGGAEREILLLPLSVLALFAMLGCCLKAPLIRLPHAGTNPAIVALALNALLLGLTLMVVLINGELRLDLSMDNVYGRRLEARDDVGSGSILAYGMTTLSYSLAPIVLLLGYSRRNYAAAGVALFAFLCIYSYRATKTDLFMPLYLIGMFELLRSRWLTFGHALIAGAAGIVALSICEFELFDTSTISGYVVRRQLIIPSMLTSYYWDFFTDHPFVYFSDKFYGAYFLAPQYDMPLTRLIGYEYFGNAENNANTCFWASAFANLGYGGMLLATILLGATLRLLDSIAENGELAIAATMAGLLGIQLSNGSFENCIITGGVAATLFILFHLRRPAPIPIKTPLRNTALIRRKELA